ncbi:Uncharacterized protein NEOC65_001849 [Neochlamydia sp. AcF65]|nr:Uncharacterized protein [Neochlamydia sp. AcF65]MBS4169486.1 Uncharacterized protein [Neochlamydia sp. AcF95]
MVAINLKYLIIKIKKKIARKIGKSAKVFIKYERFLSVFKIKIVK